MKNTRPAKQQRTDAPAGTRNTPPFAHGVEFVLIPGARRIPEPAPLVPVAYERYYQGQARIVTCPRRPQLEGMVVFLIASHGRLPTCAPYHVYHCAAGILMNADAVLAGSTRENAMIIGRDAAPCIATRLKSQWERVDVEYAMEQAARRMTAPTAQLALARRLLPQMRFPMTDAPQRLAPHRWLAEHTDVGRAPFVTALNEPFLGGRTGQSAHKQAARVDALTLPQMAALTALLRDAPWEAVWRTVLRARYGGLSPLTAQQYERVRGRRAEPPVVACALRVYWRMREQQEGKEATQDTLFPPALFTTALPCLPRPERAALEQQVRAYLEERDVRYLDDGGHLALRDDWEDATALIRALQGVRERAHRRARDPFALRAPNEVPAVPPRLTADQRRIAEHVTQHWLTVILGSPGTGKTALITWLLSHYACALATGFVGMLVKMLQRRNGRRAELAYTMDAIIYAAAQTPGAAAQWLAQFEVLVIDECSNVSMGRLRKLLPLFPRLRKLVLVGDTHQCKSLKAGDALGDLVACFPRHAFRLTENLRVAADLVTLQRAPGDIIAGNWAGIGWGAALTAPLALVGYEQAGMQATLTALFAKLLKAQPERGRRLLNAQILVLTHDGPCGRYALNAAAQHAYEQLGMLDTTQARFTVRAGLEVYAGCKITFRKNYNHPIAKDFGGGPNLVMHSDPIANGELVVIRRIWCPPKPARGLCMEVCDSHDEPPAAVKRVWVCAGGGDGGVDPEDVECGNATTVYKAQGREFPFVFFCVPPRPGPWWTRSSAYVAVSRGQERVVVLGSAHDFGAICARPDASRKTVFSHLLMQDAALREHAATPAAREPIVDDPATLTPLDPRQLAAPVLADYLAQ